MKGYTIAENTIDGDEWPDSNITIAPLSFTKNVRTDNNPVFSDPKYNHTYWLSTDGNFKILEVNHLARNVSHKTTYHAYWKRLNKYQFDTLVERTVACYYSLNDAVKACINFNEKYHNIDSSDFS